MTIKWPVFLSIFESNPASSSVSNANCFSASFRPGINKRYGVGFRKSPDEKIETKISNIKNIIKAGSVFFTAGCAIIFCIESLRLLNLNEFTESPSPTGEALRLERGFAFFLRFSFVSLELFFT